MMRKLAIALSLVSAMGTGTANALGLGEAKVNSSLNQPLSAEIELVNIRGLQQNEILPALASRQEFVKANVDRLYFLSDIRFEVGENSQGRTVIKLTTSKPVREPYLNFLVEVIWPSGRLLREYAMLIDPPLFSSDTSRGRLTSAPMTTGLPPIEVLNEEDALLQEQTGVQTAAATARPTARPAAQPAGDGSSYGPTRRSDTLWGIALKVRPDRSYSPQQVMLALQDLNPEAFVNGNINILRSGQILRVPSADDIAARSRGQAVQQVVVQNEAFEEGRSLPTRTVDSTLRPDAPSTPSMSAGETGSELKIVVAQAERQDAGDSGAHAGTSSLGGGTSTADSDLMVTLEKLDKARVENDELNSRVRDLEDQLQTLQRLLSLKDDELADLQNQFGKVDDMTATAETQPESPVEAMTPEIMETPSTEMPVEQPMMPEVSEQPMGEMPQTETPEMGEPETVVDVTPEAPVVADVKPTMAPKPELSQPTEQMPPEENIVDTILSNPLYLGGGIAGALVLILGLIGLSRHNAKKERDFHESLAVEAGDDEEIDLDFDTSDLEDSDEDETAPSSGKPEAEDPLAEADVYIAYGRLDQAAQVLENGVSDAPGRSDLRLKLLEVYKQMGETEAFHKQYNEIDALGDEIAIARADELRADMPDAGEPEISIDDLEKDLLSGSSAYTSEASMAAEELEEELDTEVEIPSSSSMEPELDFELDEADLEMESEEPELEEESLDIDFETEESLTEEPDLDLDETLDFEETALTEDEFVPADLDEATPENEVASLDLDAEEDTLDLQSVKEDLEEVSSVLAGDEMADLDDMDDLDDLDLDEDLSLEDLDAELDAEMDSVDETIEHEDDELEEESLLDEDELEADLSETIIAPPREMVEEVLEDEDETLVDALDLESELDLDDDLEEVALDSDLSIEDENGEVLEEALDLSDLDADDELEELEISEVLDEGFSLDSVDESDDVDLLDETEVHEAETDEVESEEAEEDFDFLSGTDEAATKLDLARAYIDMGDQEGARDILEEVAIEGNDDQKAEAKQLMKDLD